MQRAGTRAGEHEPFLTGLGEAAQMPPDDRDDHRGDRHDPRACPGLGQPEGKPAAADLRQLPDDSHGAHVQVDIAALQRPQRRLLNMAGRTSAWYRFPTASAALPVGLRRPNRLTWRPCLLRHPPGHPPRRAPGLGQPPGRHPARMPHPPRHLQRNHRLGPPHRHQPHPGRVTPSTSRKVTAFGEEWVAGPASDRQVCDGPLRPPEPPWLPNRRRRLLPHHADAGSGHIQLPQRGGQRTGSRHTAG